MSNIFKNTDSKLIKKVIQANGKIMAIKAQKFKGLIGQEKQKGTRLGRDVSSLVKFFGYGGIFHSDELPNYGITEDECRNVNSILKNQEKAYSILLHSVTFNERFIFGYSNKFDSLLKYQMSRL